MIANKQKLTPATKSQKEFMNQSTEMLKAATSFALFWGKGNDDYVLWETLGDTEHNINNEFKPPETENVINPDFDFSTENLSKFFFQHVFPSTVGHAKIIDKYLSDKHAPYFETVKMIKLFFMILMMLTLTGQLKTATFC
jgi:hypothetical protein